MYLIVDYDKQERFPDVFYSFEEAKEKFIELSKINDSYTLEGYNRFYFRKFIMGKEYNKMMRRFNKRKTA